MEGMETGDILNDFEAEVKRVLLFSGDSYEVVNSYYDDLRSKQRARDTAMIAEVPLRVHIAITGDVALIIGRNICSVR